MGYSPALQLHTYSVLVDNGHADIIQQPEYIADGEYETDERLWESGSGWAFNQCQCGFVVWDRFYNGQLYQCPVCGAIETINGELEEDQIGAEC